MLYQQLCAELRRLTRSWALPKGAGLRGAVSDAEASSGRRSQAALGGKHVLGAAQGAPGPGALARRPVQRGRFSQATVRGAHGLLSRPPDQDDSSG